MNQNEQKLRDALFSIKCKAEHEYKCTNSTGFSDIQAAAEQALAAEPDTDIAGTSQNWAGMDGATAFQIIERHADGWADIGKMMHEWLTANTPKPAPLVRLTDDDVMDAYSESSLDVNARLDDLFDFANAIMDAIERKNGGAA